MARSEVTYRELSELTGLSAGYLNHLVHGNRPVPDRQVIAAIATALSVQPDYFFGYRFAKVAEALESRPDVVNRLLSRFDRESEPPVEIDDPNRATVEPAEPEEPRDRPQTTGTEAESHANESCLVPGCGAAGKHSIGVRCRVWHEPSPVPGKSKTSALWAPDSDAFLCDKHALGGAHITVIYEPNDSGETAVKVIAAPAADDRRTPIRQDGRGRGTPSEANLKESDADAPRHEDVHADPDFNA